MTFNVLWVVVDTLGFEKRDVRLRPTHSSIFYVLWYFSP